jgi:hypothetical protein
MRVRSPSPAQRISPLQRGVSSTEYSNRPPEPLEMIELCTFQIWQGVSQNPELDASRCPFRQRAVTTVAKEMRGDFLPLNFESTPTPRTALNEEG